MMRRRATVDCQHPIQTIDGGVKAGALFGVVPPAFSQGLPILNIAFRLHLLLDDSKQLRPIRRHRLRVIEWCDPIALPTPPRIVVGIPPCRPQISAAQRPVVEVDDIPMMRVGRAGVDLLAADVGKDHVPVAGGSPRPAVPSRQAAWQRPSCPCRRT